MILQELLRNYIVYKEVLTPLLQRWKESFTANYYREVGDSSSFDLISVLNKAKALEDGEELGWDISDEYEAVALTQISGTSTITSLNTLRMHGYDVVYEAKPKREPALSSRYTYIVLMGSVVDESIVGIGKTCNHPQISSAEILVSSSPKTVSTTTGYESKQINSFLSLETHEKRENLGDFSLTHEETPLSLFFKKGGEQHDINQESVGTIV